MALEITLQGVEFDAVAIDRSDGIRGRVLSFHDPDSKITVSIPATEDECEEFVRRIRQDDPDPFDLEVRHG